MHLPRLTIGVLGLVTIVSYGACYYSFGALIDPIAQNTGWSQGALGATFGAVLLLTGALGIAGGRLLDRGGARGVFAVAGVLGAGGLLVASFQSSLAAFAAVYSVGCGVVGALGFYHVTQPAAIRAAPDDPARAVVWLTIIGVFASPIYLPLTARLVEATGWRDTIRVHAATVAFAFVLAAVLVRLPSRTDPDGRTGGVLEAIRGAWRVPAVRRWVCATLVGGAAIDVLLVYQVPIMIAAGLSSTTAAAIAGARGFAQLAGRIPLGVTLRRFGSRRTLAVAHLIAAAAAVVLLASGEVAAAIIYSLLAGVSIGAISTVQGIYTSELVDPRHLGMLSGVQQAVFGIGGALGPVLAGALLELSGSHRLLTAPTCAALLVAAIILLRARPAPALTAPVGASR